ncbi:hypothetical protein [Lactiplantibacillus daowaiensis]|uniref:Phage protein n=1 Tax=Lactiplantibacillus daowaiensis TaxID=2559918 RepID=A0ABW1RXU6_9LACO|nr:hypothetical protein [Lactiplantibacillus daowaiensis]
MFNNFDQFAYGFDMNAVPIEVTVPTGVKQRDELGQPIDAPQPVQHLVEPIINNNNPNINFQMVGGGSIEVGTVIWVSKTDSWPVDTRVVANGCTYHVTDHGQDFGAELTYYQLKEAAKN